MNSPHCRESTVIKDKLFNLARFLDNRGPELAREGIE